LGLYYYHTEEAEDKLIDMGEKKDYLLGKQGLRYESTIIDLYISFTCVQKHLIEIPCVEQKLILEVNYEYI